MKKSLSESAAEILATSLGSAKKDAMPVGPGAGAEDLGGETPTTPPETQGPKVSAKAKEAVTPKEGQPLAAKAVKEEESIEDEELPELTEEEMDAFLDSLSEEELAELASLVEEDDEEGEVVSEEKCEDDEDDEDEDEDEDDDKKEVKEESETPELTAEEVAAARTEALKALVSENMGSCKDDIDALFNGEELSEEFKTKATTIFEAAVRARVEAIVEKVAAENEEIMESTVSELEDQMTTQVDEYLNYVVEQWMEDNKLEIESGLRTEIAEDFMVGLKNLFTEHYIEVPEEKTDLLEELAAQVAAAQEQLVEATEQNTKLVKALAESKSQEVLRKICEGLTEVQVEKIKSLAEGVEFTTEGEYSQKLAVIRENYFPSGKKVSEGPQALVETEAKEVSSTMDRYVSAISKLASK
jgi:hypothetical protein